MLTGEARSLRGGRRPERITSPAKKQHTPPDESVSLTMLTKRGAVLDSAEEMK